MAAITSAVIVGAAAVGGAAIQSRAAKKASRAQSAASDRAIAAQQDAEGRALAFQERALDLQRPFINAGYSATAALMDMTGLSRDRIKGAATSMSGSATARSGSSDQYRLYGGRKPGTMIGDTLLPSDKLQLIDHGKGWYAVNYDGKYIGNLRPGGPSGIFENRTGFDIDAAFMPDVSPEEAAQASEDDPSNLSAYDKYSFQKDPGYQFRLDEGMKAIERSAAARGILQSGGTLRGAMRYAQDYASNEYSKVFDRIARIAGYGGSATAQGGDILGQSGNIVGNTAGNVGAALINAGEARASGYIARGNAWSNALNQGAQLFGYYNSQRQPLRQSGLAPSAWNVPVG